MISPGRRVISVGVALAALLLAACGGYSGSSGTTPAERKPAPANGEAPMGQSQAGAIPQNNGGDQDADNNGGPSDGDGNV